MNYDAKQNATTQVLHSTAIFSTKEEVLMYEHIIQSFLFMSVKLNF